MGVEGRGVSPFWSSNCLFANLENEANFLLPLGEVLSSFHPHRHTKDFTMAGVHVAGVRPGCVGDGSPPVGSRGKAPA